MVKLTTLKFDLPNATDDCFETISFVEGSTRIQISADVWMYKFTGCFSGDLSVLSSLALKLSFSEIKKFEYCAFH